MRRLIIWAFIFAAMQAVAQIDIADLMRRGGYVSAFVTDNYIGCRDPEEIARVFSDLGTISKHTHGAALRLRQCVFLSQGDLVVVVKAEAPALMLNGRELHGYFVAKSDGPAIWFPRMLLDNLRAHEPPEPDPEPVAEPDLSGPLPVGRWSVWTFFDPERHSESNNGWLGEIYEYTVELTDDGLGWMLLFHGTDKRPHDGFRFPAMGDYVWTRDDELSWEWRQWKSRDDRVKDLLVLRTTRETIYMISTATQDFISMTEAQPGRENTLWTHGERLILARLGSDAYWKLIRFYHCVKGNRGQPLHKLESCEVPFEPDERPKGTVIGRQ